jgi:hypothetical protein
MRSDAEKFAEAKGQSLAEWLRRAVQEKLDREKKGIGADTVSNEELEAMIEKILTEKLAEKRNEK